MRASGFTLLELLLVIAIIGIISVVALTALRQYSRNLELSGYTQQFGLAVQQATTRANVSNQIYGVVFDTNGIRWGPLSASVSLSACQTNAVAPNLASTVGIVAKPTNATSPTGWLCISAPGLVTRLNNLSTCAYKQSGATVPCFSISRDLTRRSVFVSGSGQTEIS